MQEKATSTAPAINESNLNRRQFGSFIYQAAHTFFTRGLLIIIAALIGILTARFLGPRGKGILAILAVPPALVCAFGELGIRQATAYLIAKKEYDPEDIQASMLALYCVTGPIALVAVLIAYYALGTFQYGLILNLMFACTAPVILLRRYANGLLLGRQLITGLNYIEFLDRGAVLLGILGLVVWLQYGLVGAGISFLLGALLSVSLLLVWISRFASLKPRWVSPILLEMLRKGFAFAISLFIVMLNYRVGILMLGTMQNEGQVGIFSVGYSISELLWQIPLSIGVVLFSRSMSWSSLQAKNRIAHVFLLLRIMLPIVTLSSGLLFMASYFMVPMLYGTEFTDSIWVLGLLLPGTIPLTLFLFMHFYAAGQGKPLLALKGFVPGLIMNIVLNWYLIPSYGYIGAACASSVSHTISVALYIHYFRKCYGGTISEIIFLRKPDIVSLKDILFNTRAPEGLDHSK